MTKQQWRSLLDFLKVFSAKDRQQLSELLKEIDFEEWQRNNGKPLEEYNMCKATVSQGPATTQPIAPDPKTGNYSQVHDPNWTDQFKVQQ